MEAQAGQQLTEQMRHVYIAQRRIADIIGSSTSDGLSGKHVCVCLYQVNMCTTCALSVIPLAVEV